MCAPTPQNKIKTKKLPAIKKKKKERERERNDV